MCCRAGRKKRSGDKAHPGSADHDGASCTRNVKKPTLFRAELSAEIDTKRESFLALTLALIRGKTTSGLEHTEGEITPELFDRSLGTPGKANETFQEFATSKQPVFPSSAHRADEQQKVGRERALG